MPNSNFLVKKWKKHLSEKVDPASINISALEVKDSLNSDVWEDEEFIDPHIKRNIERIAMDFIESLGIEVNIDDIVITGSIANYNWSRFSDIDVHILVDFDEIDENHDLVREMFQRAHAQWNRIHDIKVNDHEVEIYVQDIDEPHHSTGIYSILGDKWVKKPKKDIFTLNKDEIRAKAAHLMDDIDEIEKLLDNSEVAQAFDDATRLKEKIRNFRRGGLEKGGEYSSENLSFKLLRRNGYLERLSTMKDEAYDKMMSLEEEMVLTETMADLKRVTRDYKDDPEMWMGINRMIEGDPSDNHQYLNWFVKQLKQNPISPELIFGMVDAIKKFHDYKHLFKKTDIHQFKDPEELRAAGSVAYDEFQRREYEKEHHQELSQQASEESSMLFDGKTWSDGEEEKQEMPFTIVRPDSEHASCWHGRGTTWCISATEAQNYFDYYTGRGKVFYIVMDKTRKDRDKYKKVAWIGGANGIESQFDASQPDHAPMSSGLAREKIIESVLKKIAPEMTDVDEADASNVAQAEAFADRVQWKIAEHIKENPPESGWEEQIEDILNRFRDRMSWIDINADVEDHGDGEAVGMWGSAQMRFNNPEPVERVQMGQMPSNLGHHPSHERQTKKEIMKVLSNNYSENVPELKFGIDEQEDMFTIDMTYLPSGTENPTPEGFEEFCLIMERIDDNFAETRLLVRKILVADDYVEPNAFDKHAAGYEEADFDSTDTDEDYHYVAISYEPDAHEIKMLIPLNVPREIWDTFENRVEYNIVSGYSEIAKLNDASRKVLNTTLQQMLSKQGELPGLEDEPLSAGLDMNVRGYIPSSLEIELNGATKDKDVEGAYRIARVIDNNFEEFKKVYIENIKNYGEVRVQPSGADDEQVDLDPVFNANDLGGQVWEGKRRKKRRRSKHHKRVTGISNEPYQRMARKRFGKAMRLTVKGPQRTMPKGWKVINPVPGKSGPPGE